MFRILNYILLFSIITSFTNGQSLTGMGGLLSIPTAELDSDGTIIAGVNYLDKNFLDYTHEDYPAFTIFTTITFLPFLELGVRFTRIINIPNELSTKPNGDRMFSFRFSILQQSKYFPSIVLGSNNPVSTMTSASHFNSLYVAATKSFAFDGWIENITINVGYGSDLIKANTHEFVGIFGGVSFHLNKSVQIVTEYDAKRFNGGFKLFILNNIQLLLCLKAYKYFNGGGAIKFNL